MSSGPEWERVERPLLEHLKLQGWETLIWRKHQEADAVGRVSDRDVLLEQRLGSALQRINSGSEGKSWLDEGRVK